ncbi:hypothetical protein B5P46_11930 [Rhizobium leguminosarum]|uniref:Uncharacterized protein n=1 Tax=Rhizobium leguminosarum TaxID=384 RepID=A0A4Q1UCQ8_RHILE|nr:hypothetical protein B5P46_11930 [Rhizobium leguminosarum]
MGGARHKAEMKRNSGNASEIEKLPSVIVYPVEMAYAGDTPGRPIDGPTGYPCSGRPMPSDGAAPHKARSPLHSRR